VVTKYYLLLVLSAEDTHVLAVVTKSILFCKRCQLFIWTHWWLLLWDRFPWLRALAHSTAALLTEVIIENERDVGPLLESKLRWSAFLLAPKWINERGGQVSPPSIKNQGERRQAPPDTKMPMRNSPPSRIETDANERSGASPPPSVEMNANERGCSPSVEMGANERRRQLSVEKNIYDLPEAPSIEIEPKERGRQLHALIWLVVMKEWITSQ
jgi:hypothetical protein